MDAPPMIQHAMLPVTALDKLMPLHMLVSDQGRIASYGPTLTKLVGGANLVGQSLFAAFDIRRPSGLTTMADLFAREGERLRLTLHKSGHKSGRPIAFRGSALRLSQGGGMVLNLSFGIGLADAVRNFALTDSDFAPTDLAVEMLFLVEAKSAAMGALDNLTERLEGGKTQAEVEAATDALTGLRNRRALDLALEGLAVERAPYGMMHIDLDYFKTVNDTLGHAAGDVVLQYVARVLERETRLGDTVARVGGDEFVLVFPALTDAKRLEVIARRIIEELSQPIRFEVETCRISASIGIVTTSEYDNPHPVQLQADADEALYASKRAGRGQAMLHRPPAARSA